MARWVLPVLVGPRTATSREASRRGEWWSMGVKMADAGASRKRRGSEWGLSTASRHPKYSSGLAERQFKITMEQVGLQITIVDNLPVDI